ncbi:MAG: FAD-dependent oxidoreductase, partial [Ignavibacteriaceae bacterium]|nr:FAD-dependent oxidoreductase [Ignavibacteriaceae bacterium]
MKKVLIAGGGLAGLSAAVHLASKFYDVTLFDASPKLGGRAYSFKYTPQSGDPNFSKEYEIDNGQHILMGCYKETLKYLKIIETENKLIFQKGLTANFIDSSRNEYTLKTFGKFYPVNLLIALLNYSAIPFPERINLVKFFLKDIRLQNRTGDLTIDEWLELTGTNTIIKNRLWDFISIGALNTLPSKASAKMFRRILRLMFLEGNFSSTITVSYTHLTLPTTERV